jgi:hypothetical protein
LILSSIIHAGLWSGLCLQGVSANTLWPMNRGNFGVCAT